MSEEEIKIIKCLKDEYKKMVDNDYVLFPLYKSDTKRLIDLIDKLQEKIIQISEICIDESKCHISTKDAIEKIRRII